MTQCIQILRFHHNNDGILMFEVKLKLYDWTFLLYELNQGTWLWSLPWLPAFHTLTHQSRISPFFCSMISHFFWTELRQYVMTKPMQEKQQPTSHFVSVHGQHLKPGRLVSATWNIQRGLANPSASIKQWTALAYWLCCGAFGFFLWDGCSWQPPIGIKALVRLGMVGWCCAALASQRRCPMASQRLVIDFSDSHPTYPSKSMTKLMTIVGWIVIQVQVYHPTVSSHAPDPQATIWPQLFPAKLHLPKGPERHWSRSAAAHNKEASSRWKCVRASQHIWGWWTPGSWSR